MATKSDMPVADSVSQRPLIGLDNALRGFLVQRISIKDQKNTDTERGGKKVVDD